MPISLFIENGLTVLIQQYFHLLIQKIRLLFRITYTLMICIMAILLMSCNDDKKKEAEFQAKVEKTRIVLGNHCSEDSDCMITGCHQTMCRAMPEPEYCDQRIVLAIESEDDIPAIKSIVTDQLTVREAETVRIGGFSAGKWTLSFMATQTQRERIETALNHLSQSGFARLHPKSQDYSNKLFERLPSADTTMRSMKGAGKLVERQIRSGDVLSKDDVKNTWTQASQALLEPITENDEIELLWAYDVIFGNISQLRFWPIDKRQRISVRLWKGFETRTDNGDLIIKARISDAMTSSLKRWSEEEQLIVVLLGNEVLASAIPTQAIEDGNFELVIHDGAKNETLMESIKVLNKVSQMKGSVRIDSDATSKVERDITCHKKFPRTCACVRGTCDWKINADYNACLNE